MDRFLIRKMLRPGCFRTSPHSAFADGGAWRRGPPPPRTPPPFGPRAGLPPPAPPPHQPPPSRGGPRYIATDTRAADAVLPAAAAGLAAGKKARNRLPIDVDDLATAVDFQSAIAIVDG